MSHPTGKPVRGISPLPAAAAVAVAVVAPVVAVDDAVTDGDDVDGAAVLPLVAPVDGGGELVGGDGALGVPPNGSSYW